MRCKRRWGADHIGHELSLAASGVQAILNSEGLGRFDRGHRATNVETVRSTANPSAPKGFDVDVVASGA